MWSFVTKNKNDIIYLSLLLFSVVIGPYYRRLSNVETKKWAGSILGILLICIVSGMGAAHPILSGLFGIAAIKSATVKRCHVVTFFFMFGYLMVFRLSEKFGLPANSGQTNLIEMIIVLRVVGVAFEINGSYLSMKKIREIEAKMYDDKMKEDEEQNKDAAEKKVKDKHGKHRHGKDKGLRQRRVTEKDVKERRVIDTIDENLKDHDFMEFINPEFLDLFHYCFNYIGLLTGPYYRYRTFEDYFRLPFSKHVDCFGFTINTLKTVPLYISLYLAFSNIWPLEYILTEEHNNRSFFYRMMYPWALFAAFRQRIYSGMTLAESVCTSAGLGAYPVKGKNRSGHGPTVGYNEMKEISDEEARTIEYDFATVESMDVWGCETVVTLRDSMKVWNKAVQYWVAMVVYKRFPIRPLKIHAALFVSVIWHGYHAGYFFCIYACPFYLMAEDIYDKMFYRNATGIKRKIIGFIMWFLRSHSESYQAAAFLLLTFDRIWIYYSSMHHYWYGCWLVFLIVGILLKKLQKLLYREGGNRNRLVGNEGTAGIENEGAGNDNADGAANDNKDKSNEKDQVEKKED